MITHTESESNILRNYPFSLLDIDGQIEMWEKIYNPYIDLIENKIIMSKNNSICTFRNHNFAFNNASEQRIVDLIVSELEEQISNPASKNSGNNLNKPKEKIEDQYSDVVEKENYNLKITFVFTNKKTQPLKLMRMLKLLAEVQKYAQLLNKKVLKQYSKITPQIIFISLFGFESSIGDYLRNNVYGELNRNIPIMVVPPMDNMLWNNYLVQNLKEGNGNYEKHRWGLSFEDYKTFRKNSAANQNQVNELETYYSDLKAAKKISEHNYRELNLWLDFLSIENSSKLLDVRNSREMVNELVIE